MWARIGKEKYTQPCQLESQRPHRAAREFPLQTEIALLAGDEFAEDSFDAAMAAGEFDHSFGEGRTPEVAVEALSHLRRAL